MRVLELFAGIGGVAAAGADVVAAIDHDEAAHATYTANFQHPAHRVNLASVRPARLLAFGADLWWMSPPCQPYTVRGAKRDLDDRRAESLIHLLDILADLRGTPGSPRALIVENVPGFEGSLAHARLRNTLAGMHLREGLWCPSELGFPVERRRYYLLASEGPLDEVVLTRAEQPPLAAYLEADADRSMDLDPAFLARFGDALHVVRGDDPGAQAACFTSAYGRSPVYAGSYLAHQGRLRRFTPGEIARLHGFPEGFVLPADVRTATRLVGNSLAVPVVRALLDRARASLGHSIGESP